MPRRKITGLAQPRAPQAKTVRKELKLEPRVAKALEAAARDQGVTWTWLVTRILEAAMANEV